MALTEILHRRKAELADIDPGIMVSMTPKEYERWLHAEHHSVARVTKAQIQSIIEMAANGLTCGAIAKELGLESRQVSILRDQWIGAINARRYERAGLNIDGTPKRS